MVLSNIKQWWWRRRADELPPFQPDYIWYYNSCKAAMYWKMTTGWTRSKWLTSVRVYSEHMCSTTGSAYTDPSTVLTEASTQNLQWVRAIITIAEIVEGTDIGSHISYTLSMAPQLGSKLFSIRSLLSLLLGVMLYRFSPLPSVVAGSYVPYLISVWELCSLPHQCLGVMFLTSSVSGSYVPYLISVWELCPLPPIWSAEVETYVPYLGCGVSSV